MVNGHLWSACGLADRLVMVDALAMSLTYNVYCDESGHMEHDHLGVMVLGAVWCPLEQARALAVRLREIKAVHGLARDFEVKWNKVSPGGVGLYADLLDYFFDEAALHFRALVVPDKSLLRHQAFDQSHDEWYYKMYFTLLTAIFTPGARYRVYLDIKDTRSADKVAKLHDVLANARYDFSRDIIQRVQTVRSHEVELVQLADLLIGAISYANRGLAGNAAKTALVRRLRQRSGHDLTRSTLLREQKVNLFAWEPRGRE